MAVTREEAEKLFRKYNESESLYPNIGKKTPSSTGWR